MDFEFDLLVIGAGSGGVRCARMAASLGARVAIVEKQYYGGTCVNVGCVPKKLFYYGSHLKEELEQAAGYGWRMDNVRFDWATLRENKTQEIQRLNGVYQGILASHQVTRFDGHATILDPHTVSVNEKQIRAKTLLIATGGKPFKPDIPGIELARISDDLFFLSALPKSALIVGGGYIAVEFACILHNLGVDTTLSYRGDLFLTGFDGDVRQHIKQSMEKKGIRLQFQHQVMALEKNAQAINPEAVLVSDAQGAQTAFDLVLYATGRVPNTDDLGLESVSVAQSATGAVLVNDQFQTSVPSIYALGDVIDRVQLTPVALAEGTFLARHLFGTGSRPVDYQAIPTAVFTQPNIGTVGLTEEEARAQGYQVILYRSVFAPMKNSFMVEKEKALMKLVVDANTDRVLGAHMVGPEAGEIIQGLAIAIKMGATKAQFDATIGIHPTTAEEFVTMRTAME